MSTDTDLTRTLIDKLEKRPISGQAVITLGIAALGAEAVHRLIQTIAVFDDFYAATKPVDEHDCGVFKFDGVPVIFKIVDYFQPPCSISDHSSPMATKRVITLMLAEEC